jgi:hypothetical protein
MSDKKGRRFTKADYDNALDVIAYLVSDSMERESHLTQQLEQRVVERINNVGLSAHDEAAVKEAVREVFK